MYVKTKKVGVVRALYYECVGAKQKAGNYVTRTQLINAR